MPAVGSEIDALFFEMIHDALAGGPAPAERRGHFRESYHAVQKIAPYDGVRLPDAGEFFEVRCHGLSQGGISFLLACQPWFASLVFALEGLSGKVYVEAEVLRVSRALVYPGGEVAVVSDDSPRVGLGNVDRTATPMLLVACRFTRRLNMAADGPA